MASKFLAVLIMAKYFVCIYGFLDDVESSNINAVKMRLEEEKEKRLLLQNDLEMLMLKFAKLERKITAAKSDIEDSPCTSEARNGQNVSFFAIHSQAHISLSVGQTFIFDNVITNHGGGYSPSSGTFRAPSRGVYVFTTHILVPGSNTIRAGLFKNGNNIVSMFAGNTGSQSMVVDLEVGDEVFIQTTRAGIVHGTSYSTFLGFRLQK